MNQLSVLRTYQTDFEAELVKAKLERQGIEVFIHAGDLTGMFPSLDYTTGFAIMVEPADFMRASEIVDSPTDDLSDDMDTGSEQASEEA